MSPHVRNILGQVRSRIDARFMMDNGRIFIADVSKGKLGADKSNLMGAFLVTQFQLAAMSRADVPEAERRDFFLYVDEFQSFTSESFVSVLSEARKYRLCLTLWHPIHRSTAPGKPSQKTICLSSSTKPLVFDLKGLDAKHPYLLKRGFTPETIERFGLGFCSRGLLKDRVAIAAGVVVNQNDGSRAGGNG